MSREDAERVYRFLQGKEKFIRKMNTLSMYRLQEKSVDNLIAGIEKSKQRNLPEFINADVYKRQVWLLPRCPMLVPPRLLL